MHIRGENAFWRLSLLLGVIGISEEFNFSLRFCATCDCNQPLWVAQVNKNILFN